MYLKMSSDEGLLWVESYRSRRDAEDRAEWMSRFHALYERDAQTVAPLECEILSDREFRAWAQEAGIAGLKPSTLRYQYTPDGFQAWGESRGVLQPRPRADTDGS